MKRIITTSLAAAVALLAGGATAALAQPYQQPYQQPYDHHDDHGDDHGGQSQERHWHHGDRYEGERHVVDWRYHHLHQPPYGYEWVQDGRSYLLVNVSTGYIANIVIY